MKRKFEASSVVGVVVVVMIVGVLASLLLPSIQSAREAGRRPTARGEQGERLSQYSLAIDEFQDSAKPAATRFAAGEVNKLPGDQQATASSGRKIIYTAAIELAVEDFEGVSDRVLALVKSFNGYVADSTIDGTSGTNRRASWQIRVPIDRFDEFVHDAKDLGELMSANTKSQDVSEEYFDVDARIRNKTKEEERLLKLLEDRPGKLEDVIAIERELSRVREELERMHGRMRVLADRTSLTSVRLMIGEVHSYQPVQAASLGTRIQRSFFDSLASLQTAAESLVLLVVTLSPWLAVLLLLVAASYRLWRPWLRHAQPPAITVG